MGLLLPSPPSLPSFNALFTGSHPNSCLGTQLLVLSEHPTHSLCHWWQSIGFSAASALEQVSGRAGSHFPMGSLFNQVQWLVSAGQFDLVPFHGPVLSSQSNIIKASREAWSNFHNAEPRTGFTTPSSCRVLML